MNDWELYRADCTECVFWADGCCRKSGREISEVCPSFALTAQAEAVRYVKAKRHGQAIGIDYDATGHILAGKPESVRVLVQYFIKKKVPV